MSYIEQFKNRDIKALKRREVFLEQRIGMSNKNLTFDKEEAVALRRTINVLELLQKKPWLLKELYEDDKLQNKDEGWYGARDFWLNNKWTVGNRQEDINTTSNEFDWRDEGDIDI